MSLLVLERPDQTSTGFCRNFILRPISDTKTRQRVLQDPSLCQKWELVCKVCEMAVVLVYEFASVKWGVLGGTHPFVCQ